MNYQRYFFHVSYLGINYRGWQMQPDVQSVQQIFEESLSLFFKQKITVMGCGRTDAKVHASQYFFHVDLNEILRPNFIFIYNKMLPKDIAVFDIIPVEMNCHARFDAISRTYDYFMHFTKNPFLEGRSVFLEEKITAHLEMKSMAENLKNFADFSSFCKSPLKHHSTICKIENAVLEIDEEKGLLHFQITANRFLRGMIRLLMGKLIDIGLGKFSIEEFETCLKTNTPPKIILPAHPQGLYLSKIKYPYLDIEIQKNVHPFNIITI